MGTKRVMVRVAFFRGKGTLWDRVVRFLTRGPYSRVEVLVGHRIATGWICYGADRLDGTIRRRIRDLDPSEWDIVEVPGVSKTSVQNWFKAHTGSPYNPLRDLCVPFGPTGAESGKYGPAETAASALALPTPERYSVNSLYWLLTGDLYSMP